MWRAIIGMAVHWDVAAWPERADGNSRRGRRRRRDRDRRRRRPRGWDATAPSLRTTQSRARGAHHRCEPGRCHASSVGRLLRWRVGSFLVIGAIARDFHP